jgi:hypothetical protein
MRAPGSAQTQGTIMKRILLATVALAALCAPALAADLPAKAAPMLTPFNPFTGGFYWGVGTESSAESTQVSGNQLLVTSLAQGNIEATGQAVKGVAGYIWGGPGSWKRVELGVAYQNVTGGGAAVGNVASRWSSTAEFDIGAEILAQIYSVIPANLSGALAFPSFTPSLPGNITVTAMAPRQYVGALAKCWGVDGSIGTATGAEVACGPGLKTGFLWQTAGATGKSTGHAIDLYASVVWPMRGFTVSGLLASNPGAPMINGGMDLGPQYSAGIVLDF